MDDSYLTNAYKFLCRAIDNLNSLESSAWGGLSMCQGDMSEYYMEQHIDAIGRRVDAHRLLADYFRMEFTRRGIKLDEL